MLYIVVRVILSGKFSVCTFNLFIRSAWRNAQHLIWICHRLLPSLPRLNHCSFGSSAFLARVWSTICRSPKSSTFSKMESSERIPSRS